MAQPGDRLVVNPCLRHRRGAVFPTYEQALSVARDGDVIVLTPLLDLVYPLLSLKPNVGIDGQGAWVAGIGARFPGTPREELMNVTIERVFFDTPINDGQRSDVASLVVDTYCGVKFIDCTFYVRILGATSSVGWPSVNGTSIKAVGLVESNVFFFNCLFFFRVTNVPSAVIFDSRGLYGRQTWQNVRIRVDHQGVSDLCLFRRRDQPLKNDCSHPNSDLSLAGISVLIVPLDSDGNGGVEPAREQEFRLICPLNLQLAQLDLSGGGSAAFSDMQVSLRGGRGQVRLFDTRQDTCGFPVLVQGLMIRNTDHTPWTLQEPLDPNVRIDGLLTDLTPGGDKEEVQKHSGSGCCKDKARNRQ